jgi:hypothetical protein
VVVSYKVSWQDESKDGWSIGQVVNVVKKGPLK